ncbi:YcxB family protein [Brevundimonas sp.]|uniref:YcxB family protein n=1 Tax=Brevundimonas sp. TaxID=1871086 RepID=UPI0028ABAB3A|nr:YcxB family protein [Brevundimonas sp.]
MEVSGVLKGGETTAALAYIKARRGLSPRQIKLGLVVCLLAVVVVCMMGVFGWWYGAVVAAAAAAMGLFVGLVFLQLISKPAYKRALAARRVSYDLPLRLRLAPEHLIHEMGDVTQSARWLSVTDLYRTRHHWVFLVQHGAMVLPRCFFDTPEAESVFIAHALTAMTDEARARSPDAAKVAALASGAPA